MFDALRSLIGGWVRERIRNEHIVRGFRVVVDNTRPDIATADVIARLDEALALIEKYQPWRLAHLRRDLSQYLIARFPCRGAYFPAERTCLTELTFLARRDIGAAVVAANIIHEGMHARAHRMAPNKNPQSSAREERLCRRAELEFGQALPMEIGRPVIERASLMFELPDEDVAPAIDWNEARSYPRSSASNADGMLSAAFSP
jgi:hypothetical protein